MTLRFFNSLTVAAALSLHGVCAWAQSTPMVHGSIIRDYARVTFEWPNPVFLNAKASGKTVTITFDHEAEPDFKVLLRQLSPYISSAKAKPDGKTVVLTLTKPYRIRTFVSDTINGIDILDIHQKPAQAKAAPLSVEELASASDFAELSPSAGQEREIAQLGPPNEAALAMPVKKAPEEKPKTEAVKSEVKQEAAVATPPEPVNPEAPPQEAVAPKPVTQAPEEAPKEAASAVVAPAVVDMPKEAPKETPQEPVSPSQTEAPTPAVPEAPKVVEGGDGQALIAGGAVAEEEADNGMLKVNLSAGGDYAALRLPFKERVALAVFVRAHSLWVVINKPLPLDLSDFEPLPKTVVGKPEVIKSDTHTIFYMPIDDGVHPSVTKEENSFNWAVLIGAQKKPVANALGIAVNTDPPAPPHVFVSTLEIAEPAVVTDPLVGDEMVITPLFKPGEGILLARDFTEFTLPTTAQGVIVNKKADDVAVVQLRNGLRISLPQGASLTPGLPAAETDKLSAASQSVATLFPYDLWKPEEPAKLPEQIKELFQKVVLSENIQESNDARFRLAQLYLSDGMAPEALAYLDGINRTNPSFYRSNKLAALRGACNFLMSRFPDAAKDFSAAELNDNKEVDYWRHMLADLLGGADHSYDFLGLNQDYISKYPPLLRQRLAIVSADRAIGAKEYNTALKIFDSLETDHQLSPIHAYITYLIAKISSDTGQEKEALEMWDKLAEDYDHPFVRSRAEFSRTIWSMNAGMLSKDKAIERLERLRLAWHGDSLELNIASILGDLYVERKDYINAMRIWHGIVTGFPNTSYAQDFTRKMQEAFITLFNSEQNNLSTIDALAIYGEYRNYAPSGTTGDEIVNRLADKLVSLDLLEQAMILLDHQMRVESEKEGRSEVGAKLASIYLMNHQPSKALQALEDSVYGENSLMLRLKRNRLTAEALIDQRKPDKALVTLGQDTSVEAERLRIRVYWMEKDWSKLTESIETLLQERKDVTAPITLGESEYLLKLALAYIFENDRDQLKYLRDYFGPLMAKNPNKPVFDFITGGDFKLTTTNFDDVLKYLENTRNFIENYRAEIKESPPEVSTAAK